MPVRRLNYTGRQRLHHADMRFTIHTGGDGSPTFDADLSFDRYCLPSNAPVFVEAYRQTTWMRFPFGKVGRLHPPDDRRLTEFDSPEGVRFRVRVTSPVEPIGLELAEADRIEPRKPEEKPENRTPLLTVVPSQNMGDRICRVDFGDGDYPLLLVNAAVGNWKEVVRQPAFISLVYPTALEQILGRILFIENYSETDDAEDWRSQWLRFASLVLDVGNPPALDEREQCDEWIDNAVAAFCRKFRTLKRFFEYWTHEETT